MRDFTFDVCFIHSLLLLRLCLHTAMFHLSSHHPQSQCTELIASLGLRYQHITTPLAACKHHQTSQTDSMDTLITYNI